MSTEKAKGMLAKIKELFEAASAPILLEHKLADGTVLKMDKSEVGGKLTVNGAPVTVAGEYTLPDGMKIVYDVAGTITGVTPAPATAAPANAAPVNNAPATFTDYKLADGTAISIDKLEVGGAVKIGGTPAPAGEYKMEDGSSITVDATGAITVVTPKVAAAAAPALDMSTAEGIAKAYAKYAEGGNIDVAGMNTILKALMEYSFGWQLREQQEKATRDAAMKVYNDSLQAKVNTLGPVVTQQAAMLKQMFELMTEVVGLPTGDPPPGRKKFSFSNVELKTKSLEKYQQAAQRIAKENEELLKAV